jgi:hypothetical protein
MRFSRRLVKAFLSTALAILFAFLAVMRIPQAAFGFVSSSIIRDNSQQSQLLQLLSVNTNTPQEAIALFQKRLTCLKTEQIKIEDFNPEPAKIREVVRRLAKTEDFRDCITRNGITGVNPDTLVGVIFTSAVADKFAVVVAGAGLKQSIDVSDSDSNNNVSDNNVSSNNVSSNNVSDNNVSSNNVSDNNVSSNNVSSNNNGAPNNGIVVTITNAKEIDGHPFTVGQVASLKVVAIDQKTGKDLSDTIVWQNAESQTIGSGSSLNYPLQQVKNETIKAEVTAPNGSKNWNTVSFTVSPPGLVLGQGVKVLPDNVQKYIIGDMSLKNPGKLCLTDNPDIPKINVGDIVLGAGGIIPPVKVKVLQKQNQGNTLCMTIEFAKLKDVFKDTGGIHPITPGGKPQKLSYSPNGGKWVDFKPYNEPKTGYKQEMTKGWTDYLIKCNQDGYAYRYNKRNSLDTRNSGGDYRNPYVNGDFPTPEEIIPSPNNQFLFPLYKDTETTVKTEYSIDSDVYLGYEFNPYASGNIGFSFSKGLNLELTMGGNETLIGGLTLEAFYNKSISQQKTLASTDGPTLAFSIGPIPVWIDFPLFLDFNWDNSLKVELKNGVFGIIQTGYFDLDLKYDDQDGFVPQTHKNSLSALIACGESDLDGKTKVALIPRVQALIYSLAGPELGLEAYLEGDFNRPNRNVHIVSPSDNTEFNQNAPIYLKANLDPGLELPITAEAGIDLTGKLLSVNQVLFPPAKLTLIPGLCIAVWCTHPVEVDFDINQYFNKLSFNIPVNALTQEKYVSIPLGTKPFEQLTASPMKDATVVWQADGNQNLGTSNPSTLATLTSGSLSLKNHNLKATAYAPLDINLEKPLGSNQVTIDITDKSVPTNLILPNTPPRKGTQSKIELDDKILKQLQLKDSHTLYAFGVGDNPLPIPKVDAPSNDGSDKRNKLLISDLSDFLDNVIVNPIQSIGNFLFPGSTTQFGGTNPPPDSNPRRPNRPNPPNPPNPSQIKPSWLIPVDL